MPEKAPRTNHESAPSTAPLTPDERAWTEQLGETTREDILAANTPESELANDPSNAELQQQYAAMPSRLRNIMEKDARSASSLGEYLESTSATREALSSLITASYDKLAANNPNTPIIDQKYDLLSDEKGAESIRFVTNTYPNPEDLFRHLDAKDLSAQQRQIVEKAAATMYGDRFNTYLEYRKDQPLFAGEKTRLIDSFRAIEQIPAHASENEFRATHSRIRGQPVEVTRSDGSHDADSWVISGTSVDSTSNTRSVLVTKTLDDGTVLSKSVPSGELLAMQRRLNINNESNREQPAAPVLETDTPTAQTELPPPSLDTEPLEPTPEELTNRENRYTSAELLGRTHFVRRKIREFANNEMVAFVDSQATIRNTLAKPGEYVKKIAYDRAARSHQRKDVRAKRSFERAQSLREAATSLREQNDSIKITGVKSFVKKKFTGARQARKAEERASKAEKKYQKHYEVAEKKRSKKERREDALESHRADMRDRTNSAEDAISTRNEQYQAYVDQLKDKKAQAELRKATRRQLRKQARESGAGHISSEVFSRVSAKEIFDGKISPEDQVTFGDKILTAHISERNAKKTHGEVRKSSRTLSKETEQLLNTKRGIAEYEKNAKNLEVAAEQSQESIDGLEKEIIEKQSELRRISASDPEARSALEQEIATLRERTAAHQSTLRDSQARIIQHRNWIANLQEKQKQLELQVPESQATSTSANEAFLDARQQAHEDEQAGRNAIDELITQAYNNESTPER